MYQNDNVALNQIFVEKKFVENEWTVRVRSRLLSTVLLLCSGGNVVNICISVLRIFYGYF